ncbi:VWA domain-containing protein [Phenylobacterium sp.]|uniref:vWA domain-containing protein n=1 Tax=Phenylobacterium sp. TaxID=1871053 RepID=UPI002731B0D0|nr:VWA domain-containing protein [Phenylobacterium sp.]MDP2215195.1 VWA domain-containing protein [Phenylobacterium sp.]
MAPTAIRTLFTVGLAGLMASAPMAAAASRNAGGLQLDGDPTSEVCARLGFRAPDRRGLWSSGSPPPPGMAAPMPSMAAPPVMAAPMSERSARTPAWPRPVPGPSDTERYPEATANPIKRTAQDPVSTFSIDVDTASYANVRRFLNDGERPPTDAVRVEELVNYFDYGYQRPSVRYGPFAASAALAPSPWSEHREILHIGLQGYELPEQERPPLNLVFLIDTSGSMDSPDRLPLARKAMNVLIDQLRPQDRVAMVAYAGSAGAVLPPTEGRQKLMMRCALTALSAGGSTAGGQGLALAYDLAQQNFDSEAINRVILLTDGDFNVGLSDPARLEDFVAEKRKSGVFLSVYGFGRGNYNDRMMQTLAQNGNGTAAYIDTLAEARRLFLRDLPASMFPIAQDVKIQVEFNPAQVSEYRLIGYETRLLNREDFNNDQVDAGEVGSGASVTALYEITRASAPGSSDPLRYQSEFQASGHGSEIAFVKVRYQPPGGGPSILMTRPVTAHDRSASLAAAPEATRWAMAVAAFGQKLRGDPWLDPGFGWDEIEAIAQAARGRDPDGDRAEFITLVRSASGAHVRPVAH